MASGISPGTASLLGDVIEGAAKAVSNGLKANNDADALRIARETLLDAIAAIESAEARATKFPELRED